MPIVFQDHSAAPQQLRVVPVPTVLCDYLVRPDVEVIAEVIHDSMLGVVGLLFLGAVLATNSRL